MVAVAIILIILVVLYFCIGIYFYNFALKSEKNKKDETTDYISDYEKEIIETSKKWFNENAKDVFVGDLHGFEINQNSDKWAIVVHGYKGRAKNMTVATSKFFEMGFNTLTPDLRGHGQSKGNYIAMGWDDRIDIIKWINYILEKNKNAKIILYGVSMGAATVMMTSGEKLSQNVKCIVEDCGYSSIWDEFKYQLKTKFKLPVFPVLYSANTVCKLKARYNIKDGACIKALEKSKIPMLFIHGDCDDFVPFYMLDEVYNAHAGEKEKLVIKGAKHAKAYVVEPEIYWNKIKEFVNKYV